MNNPLHIIGSGLAGSEAAWQAAQAGRDVDVGFKPNNSIKANFDEVAIAQAADLVTDSSAASALNINSLVVPL